MELLDRIISEMPGKMPLTFEHNETLTASLVVNFKYLYETGNLWWPKSLGREECSRRMFQNNTLMKRLQTSLHSHFFISRIPDSTSLCCSIDILPNTTVAYFMGKFISSFEYVRLPASSKLLYEKSPHESYYMARVDDICYARAARISTLSNCRFKYNPKTDEAYIYALVLIKALDEISYHVRPV